MLAANWIMAGIAFSFWVYTVGNFSHGSYMNMVREEYRLQGKELIYDDDFHERYWAKRKQYQQFESMARIPWGFMTLVCSGTAIGLMIGFPKPEPEQKPKKNQDPINENIDIGTRTKYVLA